MTQFALRDYQQRGIADIRNSFLAGNRRTCYVLPTGGGKTHTFAWLSTRSAENKKKVCILVHREELIDQVSAALSLHGCKHGIVKSGRDANPNASVQVASVFTLARRLHQYPEFNLIIIDECHHAPAGSWAKVCDHYPAALILGVTATPVRLDGKGLANSFDALVVGPSIADLINDGYLVKPIVYAPSTADLSGIRTLGGDYNKQQLAMAMDRPTIYGDVIAHWKRLANELPTVAFCVSVEHAEHTAAEFRAAGIPATSIDGSLDSEQRKRRIDDLRRGCVRVLTSCDLISEGFDLPGIHAAILLRPTKSLSLYLQQVGRALRPAPGKQHAIILDHAGNCHRHGMPTEHRKWELTQDKKKGENPFLRTCPECYAVYAGSRKSCPVCGHEGGFERDASRAPDKKPATVLRQLTEDEMRWKRLTHSQALKRAKSIADLQAFARAKGYKPGWVYHKSRELGFRK